MAELPRFAEEVGMEDGVEGGACRVCTSAYLHVCVCVQRLHVCMCVRAAFARLHVCVCFLR
jgi:hypothetical protein